MVNIEFFSRSHLYNFEHVYANIYAIHYVRTLLLLTKRLYDYLAKQIFSNDTEHFQVLV